MNYELPDDPRLDEDAGKPAKRRTARATPAKRAPSITEIATALALAAARNGHAVEKADYCFNGDWDLPVGDYLYVLQVLGRSMTTAEHRKLRREYERLVRLAFTTCDALNACDGMDPHALKHIEGEGTWAELVAEDETRIQWENDLTDRIPPNERRHID
jgi:hypothetical protein